jgi:hypothetical protein
MPASMGLARTLTELDLNIDRQQWLRYDRSRMDFSSFLVLNELTASALCFMCPTSMGVSRNGLYKLLPPSLKSFEVRPSE